MKKKIWIIDDCFPILNSLRMMLEMHHYEVEIAENGAFLLDNNDVLADILLVDYHIPGVSGSNIFNKMNSDPRFKHIPVILMSGDKDIERISLLLGVNDFIAKPFNFDDLLKKIEICLSHSIINSHSNLLDMADKKEIQIPQSESNAEIYQLI